jgi:hypothetical protein
MNLNGGKLGMAGLVPVDFDDFTQGGNARRRALMEQLRTILASGKWQDIYKSSAEHIGRNIIQIEDYEIQVYMQRYVENKLNPVKLAPKRENKQMSS